MYWIPGWPTHFSLQQTCKAFTFWFLTEQQSGFQLIGIFESCRDFSKDHGHECIKAAHVTVREFGLVLKSSEGGIVSVFSTIVAKIGSFILSVSVF